MKLPTILFTLLVMMIISKVEAASYFWFAGNAGAWNSPTSWSPTRNFPATSDTIIFNCGSTVSVSNVPSETINEILVSNSTSVNLLSTNTQTLLLGNGSSGYFEVGSGSYLSLNANTGLLTLQINPNATARVYGTIELLAQSEIYAKYSGVSFHVDGTMINAGVFYVPTDLSFSSGSVYRHNWTSLPGVMPIANWDVNSTVEFYGYTSNNTWPQNLNQSYGNVTYNCPNQTININFSSFLTTIRGNFNIISTGTATLILSPSNDYKLTIGGNFNQTGGTLDISNGSGLHSFNVYLYGNFYVAAASHFTDTNNSAGADVNWHFSGKQKTITFLDGSSAPDSTNIKWTVDSGAYVTMLSNMPLYHPVEGFRIDGSLNTGNYIIKALVPGCNVYINDTLIITNSNGLEGKSNSTVSNFYSPTTYFNVGTTIVYAGTGTQTISSRTNYVNMVINGGGYKVPNGACRISGTLTFLNGIVQTSSTALLTLNAAANISGADSNSYVSGPLAMTWPNSSATRTYPIGKDGIYRPVTVNFTSPTQPVLVVEMFNGNAGGSSSLDKISEIRYYKAYLTSGSASNGGSFTISYGYDDVVQHPGYAVIAQSTGQSAVYTTINQTSFTSNTITSGNYDPNNGAWLLLGSTALNPLPVSLIQFEVKKEQSNARILWTTATEINNAYFTIERSTDGLYFLPIANVEGNGNSTEKRYYSYEDMNLPNGTVYYCLKQVDNNGRFSYSNILSVMTESNQTLNVYPNPFINGKIYFQFDQSLQNNSILKIYSAQGIEVFTTTFTPGEGGQNYETDLTNAGIKSGMYLFVIESGNKIFKKSVLKQ